jgi:phosphomannomutase/phosphoglucomutase
MISLRKIEGKYPDEINEDLAYKIGIFLGKSVKKIVVGCDIRQSSPELKRFLIKGLLENKTNVIDIGIISLPLLKFSISKYKFDAGVMVTGCSSPNDYNGFKIFGNFKIDMKVLKKIKGSYIEIGDIDTINVEDEYTKFILSNVKIKRPLKVVIDAGNGVAGLITVRLFQKAGCEVIPLYCDPDWRFPHHLPDISSLDMLRKKIFENKADIGIIYDGDACKCAILDKNGEKQKIKNKTDDAIYDSLKMAEYFSKRT